MYQYTPFSPVEVHILDKENALDTIEKMTHGKNNILILASDRLVASEGLGPWITNLGKNRKCTRIARILPNPTIAHLCGVLQELGDQGPEQIIAFGGGSSIDLAKAISALFYLIPPSQRSEQRIRQAILAKEYIDAPCLIEVIAIPTTAGTGSEVTKWATIWDMEQRGKLSIDCTQIYPKAAILVPEFTVSMPSRLTLSSGLDALSHAMEAFWAKSRTPLSQTLALLAATHLREYLPKVLQDGNNLEARKEMCLASLLAGLAFSITRTTACHSISYPLTMRFGIEHGLAAAISLVAVAKRNFSAVPEIEELLNIWGDADRFQEWITAISEPVQPLKLSAFEIGRDSIGYIAAETFTQGRMDNNPILFSEEEVNSILLECY